MLRHHWPWRLSCGLIGAAPASLLAGGTLGALIGEFASNGPGAIMWPDASSLLALIWLLLATTGTLGLWIVTLDIQKLRGIALNRFTAAALAAGLVATTPWTIIAAGEVWDRLHPTDYRPFRLFPLLATAWLGFGPAAVALYYFSLRKTRFGSS